MTVIYFVRTFDINQQGQEMTEIKGQASSSSFSNKKQSVAVCLVCRMVFVHSYYDSYFNPPPH